MYLAVVLLLNSCCVAHLYSLYPIQLWFIWPRINVDQNFKMRIRWKVASLVVMKVALALANLLPVLIYHQEAG